MKNPLRARTTFAALLVLSATVVACSSGRSPVPSGVESASVRLPMTACIKGWSDAADPGVPFHVVDDSGLTEKGGDAFNLYVTNQGRQYLNPVTGKFSPLTTATVPPIPVAKMCADFQLPPGSASRAYISFGALPMTISQPNPKNPHDPSNRILYDWMEFGTPAGSVYNIQADMFGLPLQATMSDASTNVYAFGYNDYDKVIAALKGEPWKDLLVCGKVGTNHNDVCPAGQFPVRIQAPGTAAAPGGTGFPTYWTNYRGVNYLDVVGKAINDAAKGAIVYVAYQISYPNPNANPKGLIQGCGNFPNAKAGLPCPGYDVTYDATGKQFVFTLVSPAPPEWSPSPDQTFPKIVKLPVAEYFNDYDIWAQPAPKWVPSTPPPTGGTPPPISSLPMKEQVAFYLLKDMDVDLNRGVATTAGTPAKPEYHALLPACMPTPISPACVATNYYKADRLNEYSAALHQNSIDIYAVTKSDPIPKKEPGTAYGFPYDDKWDQSSSVTPANTIKCLQIRILPMTAAKSNAAKPSPPGCAQRSSTRQ